MMPLLADHLWQSTLWALGVAVLARAFERQPAQVRYLLWLSASVKFLVPFSALVWLGEQLAPAAAASPAIGSWFTIEIATHSLPSQAAPMSKASLTRLAPQGIELTTLLVALWGAGVIAVAAAWYVRWRRAAMLVRAGVPIDGITDELPVLSSAAATEPGIVGIFRPVLLWPSGAEQRLTRDEIDAVVAHELCHVRRRDNLAFALHTAAQAAFWFHPLVWWTGARLLAERERACDEAVLRQGSRPRVYADSILKTCRFSLESRLACVSGMSGVSLSTRIEQIMRNDAPRTLTMWKKALLAAIPVTAVAIPIVVGAQQQVIVGGGAPAPGAAVAAPSGPMSFEVASVKPNNSGENFIRFGMQPGGRFTAANAPLREIIRFAYALQNFQIVEAPGWIASERFDINAKAEGDVPPGQPGTIGPVQLMMQSLLAERFGLEARRESREMPRYDLVLARADGRLGPGLKTSTTDCQAIFAAARRGGGPPPAPPGAGEPIQCGFRIGPGRMQAGAFPLSQLANALAPQVQRFIVDRTGLTGNFDLDMTYTPDQMPQGPPPPGAPAAPPIDPNGPSIFTALQEQLGLKLESVRGPVDVLVIESVNRPTPD
ncbi:MAG: TIGR03435 family protein [Acidimicrobiia bacterium]|nr:TIGR03435 family protein [Acidimicrobiia bacterium]